MVIRPEQPNDGPAIRQVIVEAFSKSEFGYHGEADLVEQLRDGSVAGEDATIVSLVAVVDGDVAGHVMFSPVAIESVNGPILRGTGLGPLSVLPTRQGAGIGTRLVAQGLSQLDSAQTPFSVVLGSKSFYSRFGFHPAEPQGVMHGFAPLPQDAFFIRWLSTDAHTRGRAWYSKIFGSQHEPHLPPTP